MKITLDYEEYLKLKEKADLNQSNIDKRILKQINQIRKDMEKQYKEYKNDELREKLIKSIKFALGKRTNIFGYVKSKDIDIYLDELI